MSTQTSKVNAVNQMLSAVGQTPVDSLGSGVNALAKQAEGILDEAIRDVQSEAWYFNTEYKVTYAPDGDGFINLGDNVYHADSERTSLNYQKRGTKLYNLEDHTFVFTNPVDLTVVKCLLWDELPQLAKAFISARATRILAERFDRDNSIIRTTQIHEREARTRLVVFDADQADANVLTDDPHWARANFYGGRSSIERGR